MKFKLIIFSYFIIILVLTLNYLCITGNTFISINNTLCFSWIPYNKYEIRSGLCNINCSYIRYNPFPSNTPFNCKEESTFRKENKNTTYNIYLFNTSTYGKYIKQYRFFYQKSYV